MHRAMAGETLLEYILMHRSPDGVAFNLVGVPCQFDEEVPKLSPAPEVGAHTEEVLLEMGMTWEEIAAFKRDGAII